MALLNFRQFLVEGGGNVAGVTRIRQENVASTVASFGAFLEKYTKISKTRLKPLGSTGKKKPGEFSGDIDLMLDCSKEKDVDKFLSELHKKLQKLVSSSAFQPGFRIISVAYPISGKDQKGENVQIDLMASENPEWTQFSFHSPHSKDSKYKGMILKKLVIALVSNVDKKILESRKDIDGNPVPVTFDRYVMDNASGVWRVRQTYLDQKDKKTVTKTKKTLSKKFVTDDPNRVAAIFLGKRFGASDFDSYESLEKAIKSPGFAYPRLRDKILSDAKKDILESEGLLIPD